MKTIKNYLPLLTLAFFTLFYSCNETTTKESGTVDEIATIKSEEENNFDACRTVEVQDTADDEMHLLYYDCSVNNKYQNLHIDVNNGFGILGKMNVNPTTGDIENMYVRLKEVGNCKRYYVSEAKYYPASETDSDFEHNLVLKIEDSKGRSLSDSIPVIGNLGAVANGEILDVHFAIKEGELTDLPRVTLEEKNGKISFVRVDKVITYGSQYCKSKIIMN